MIKLHKPYLGVDEKRAVLQVLDSREIGSGGKMGKLFENDLQNYFKVKHIVTVPSGTAALELAVASLGIKEGDEVIVPSFTFPSDATAVLLQGATVKFADIDPVYFNMNPASIRKQISPKTRAIIIVHYGGMSCQMDKILSIAKEFGLKVIEDSSHAWGSTFKGKLLGTLGDIGCFSLHATKNITSGEGGVFITNNKKIFEKAEIYRQVGTNRHHFLQGKINKYQWVSKGSGYYMSGLQAVLAAVQLKKLNEINKKRTLIAKNYLKLLRDVQELTLPSAPTKCRPSWNIFAVLVNGGKRDELMRYLKSKGIETAFHYVPLHSSIMGRKLGYKNYDFQVTNSIASSLLRLPIYPELTDNEIRFITKEIRLFFGHNK